jgi:hypothetical protein
MDLRGRPDKSFHGEPGSLPSLATISYLFHLYPDVSITIMIGLSPAFKLRISL